MASIYFVRMTFYEDDDFCKSWTDGPLVFSTKEKAAAHLRTSILDIIEDKKLLELGEKDCVGDTVTADSPLDALQELLAAHVNGRIEWSIEEVFMDASDSGYTLPSEIQWVPLKKLKVEN